MSYFLSNLAYMYRYVRLSTRRMIISLRILTTHKPRSLKLFYAKAVCLPLAGCNQYYGRPVPVFAHVFHTAAHVILCKHSSLSSLKDFSQYYWWPVQGVDCTHVYSTRPTVVWCNVISRSAFGLPSAGLFYSTMPRGLPHIDFDFNVMVFGLLVAPPFR